VVLRSSFFASFLWDRLLRWSLPSSSASSSISSSTRSVSCRSRFPCRSHDSPHCCFHCSSAGFASFGSSIGHPPAFGEEHKHLVVGGSMRTLLESTQLKGSCFPGKSLMELEECYPWVFEQTMKASLESILGCCSQLIVVAEIVLKELLVVKSLLEHPLADFDLHLEHLDSRIQPFKKSLEFGIREGSTYSTLAR